MKIKSLMYLTVIDSGLGWLVGSGEIPRGERMLSSGTDPESHGSRVQGPGFKV